MFLLLNGQLGYNSFPSVRACGVTRCPPCPQRPGCREQGDRLWSWTIGADRHGPGGDGGRKAAQGYGPSLGEMNRTALCNTAPSSATLGFLCPAPAAWKTVWGKIFQSIHIFSIKTQALSPTSTKALRSPVFQRPRSHCGFGTEDLNLIQQLIRIRSPRHF